MSDTGQEQQRESRDDGGTVRPGAEAQGEESRTARRREQEVLHLLDEGHEIPDAFVDTHQVQKHQGDDHHDLIHLLGQQPVGSFSEVHQMYSVHGDDDDQFSEDQNHILDEEELHAFHAASEALNTGEGGLGGGVYVGGGDGDAAPRGGVSPNENTAANTTKETVAVVTSTTKHCDNNNKYNKNKDHHHDGSILEDQQGIAPPTTKTSVAAASNKRYREKYTWWWEDGLIQPILESVAEYKSYYKAVKKLKNSDEMNADGRYDRLAASTVESWYIKGSYTELKEQYAAHRNKLTKPSRPGQKSILSQYPDVLNEVLGVVGAEVRRVDGKQAQEAVSHEKFDMLRVQKDIRTIIMKHGKGHVLAENGGKLTISQKFVRRLVSKNFPNARPFALYKKKRVAVGVEADGAPLHIDIQIPMEAGVSEICTDPGLLPASSS